MKTSTCPSDRLRSGRGPAGSGPAGDPGSLDPSHNMALRGCLHGYEALHL